MDVSTRKQHLIVNFGETLSKMTGRKVKATIHRVKAIGRARQSVAFFLEPGYSALLPNHLPEDPEKECSSTYHPKEDSYEYGRWLRNYIQKFIEYKGFDIV